MTSHMVIPSQGPTVSQASWLDTINRFKIRIRLGTGFEIKGWHKIPAISTVRYHDGGSKKINAHGLFLT